MSQSGSPTAAGMSSRAAGARRAWWQESWVRMAALIMAAHVGVFWVISPNPVSPPRSVGPASVRFAVEPWGALGEGDLDAWRWLFTPSVWVRPSAEDFSGAAWLRGAPVRIEVEAFDVPERPLPWGHDRPAVLIAEPGPHPGPGPSGRWDLPDESVATPAVGPVPVLQGPRLRILGGLAGRSIRAVPDLGGLAPAVPARPVVVRLRVDADGEPAGPPVLWDGSEVPEADEAALRAARSLRFEAGSAAGGLVEFEWPPAASTVETGRRGGGG